jgi:hypothetical protein
MILCWANSIFLKVLNPKVLLLRHPSVKPRVNPCDGRQVHTMQSSKNIPEIPYIDE